MNKKYTLEKHQFISKKKSIIFDFFKNPKNLEKITPENLNFKIHTPFPIIMDRGTIIDYQIKLFNIPVHWRTLIKEYNSPNSFKDIQLNGPYQKWEHIHTFKECKNGTMMIDEITYSIPFGIIGRLMHFIWVKRELKKIFNYRYKVINEIFEENK